jgi:phosphoglucomutase
LTPEVKATFTGKLALNPRDSCGRKVKDKDVVRIDGLKLVCDNGSWLCYPFPAPSRI